MTTTESSKMLAIRFPEVLEEFSADIEALGVDVVTGLLPNGWWGAYDWRDHRIILRPRLGRSQLRSTLAHELGHASYRHRGTTEQGEREATAWAVSRLLDPSRFAEAFKEINWAGHVCQKLGVMPFDATEYLRSLTPSQWAEMQNMLAMEPREWPVTARPATGERGADGLREGLEELMGELDRNGQPRRMVSVKDLRALLAAHPEPVPEDGEAG